MPTLTVTLTQNQYDRFKVAMAAITSNPSITDSELIAQLMREAAAVTYSYEVGSSSGDGWVF